VLIKSGFKGFRTSERANGFFREAVKETVNAYKNAGKFREGLN